MFNENHGNRFSRKVRTGNVTIISWFTTENPITFSQRMCTRCHLFLANVSAKYTVANIIITGGCLCLQIRCWYSKWTSWRRSSRRRRTTCRATPIAAGRRTGWDPIRRPRASSTSGRSRDPRVSIPSSQSHNQPVICYGTSARMIL